MLRTVLSLCSFAFGATFALAGCPAEDPMQVEADLTACNGARLDDAGACRSPNGRFASARCCASGALTDEQIEAQLEALLDGLTTDGSEGDPDPYEVNVFDLEPETPLTCGFLAPKLIAQMDEFLIEPDDPDFIQDCDVESLNQFWADSMAEPDADELLPEDLEAARAASKRWAEVRAFVEEHLRDRGYFLVGYRFVKDGTLATGAVSHTIFGRSATGRVFVIAGIDFWS